LWLMRIADLLQVDVQLSRGLACACGRPASERQ
jgi:hypothetical protein